MPSDIWAVGMTFFMLLWGELKSPFPNYDALMTGKPEKLPDYVPEYLKTLIFRMLQMNPDARPKCKEVLAIIEEHDVTSMLSEMSLQEEEEEKSSMPQPSSADKRVQKLEECIERESELT